MRGAGAGAGKAAGAGAPSDGSDFQMTEEEVSRFQKAFKDPSFRDMFREFAEELADPANRELRAKELAALEREQAILEGRSVDSVDTILVQPSASFCVKVRDATSHKVFINVCVSDKIEPAHEEDKQQKQQPQRQQRDTPSAPRAWQIPFCLAAPRRERDHANESCMTYDFVVAPNAIELAKRSPAFHKMLVETAVETVASRFTESIKTAGACGCACVRARAAPRVPVS